MLGTTKRSDGKPQVTYNGHPLYRYEADQKPGDTNGQGLNAFGGAWFVLSPTGNKVTGQGLGQRLWLLTPSHGDHESGPRRGGSRGGICSGPSRSRARPPSTSSSTSPLLPRGALDRPAVPGQRSCLSLVTIVGLAYRRTVPSPRWPVS